MANDEGESVGWTPSRPGTKPLTPHRPVKLQVCFSPDERARLDERARAAGYESAAAFIRARTLAQPA